MPKDRPRDPLGDARARVESPAGGDARPKGPFGLSWPGGSPRLLGRDGVHADVRARRPRRSREHAIELVVIRSPTAVSRGPTHATQLDREVAAVFLSPSVVALAMPPDTAMLMNRRLKAARAAGIRVSTLPRQNPAGALCTSLDELAAAGIGPGLVLLIGTRFATVNGRPGADTALLSDRTTRCAVVAVDETGNGLPAQAMRVPGGGRAVCDVLEAVRHRAVQGRVPGVDHDPAWVICEAQPDPRRQRVSETLLALGGGGVGTRGSLEEEPAGSVPLVAAAGIYESTGGEQQLLPLPGWTHLDAVGAVSRDRRVLDLRTGVLLREQADRAAVPLRTARFASATLPGVMALRAEGRADAVRAGPPLTRTSTRACGDFTACCVAGTHGSVAIAAQQETREDGTRRAVERIAAYAPSWDGAPKPGAAAGLLTRARRLGFERLLQNDRAEWARRWSDVDIRIPDDPHTQLAVRYALFQLWSQTAALGELAVGARGLSGPAYAGHVFWDADAFVLPALVSIHPAAAHAMVRYRTRRLAAARAHARRHGEPGARFPWESAAEGDDVTPSQGRLGGEVVEIRTGQQEEHITADVAWGTAFAADWSGMPLTRSSAAGRLLAETARYWQGRCRIGPDGRAHIRTVIGPDEYHENVDDNAFTNVMARWNLRRAAQLLDGSRHSGEAALWRQTADVLVDGYDPATGRYEQFAGYDRLEPLAVSDIGTPPLAADLLLGPRRVAGSQLIKQPDVLMLHYLVPEETAPESLVPNIDFYGPRTAHGSSLSPAVTATLLARAGRPDEALRMLQVALSIDLADRTGTTAGGLHMATLAGIWRCLLTGFGGIRVVDGQLLVAPVLPSAWGSLELRFRALGRRVQVHIDGGRARVTADGPMTVRVPGRPARRSKRAGVLDLAAEGSR